MQNENFNEKYHLLRKDINPKSLYSSFSVFKKLTGGNVIPYDQRPPYPIIVNDPTTTEVFYNLNKSDVLLGLSFVAAGFGASVLCTRKLLLLEAKFLLTKYMMWWYTGIGGLMAMSCSYYRLVGLMENGLRWKHKDLVFYKYDLTSDFERDTIFKHFRERVN